MRFIKFQNGIKPQIGFIPFFLISINLVSCISKSQNSLYNIGTSFHFEVSTTDSISQSIVDTLSFEIKDKGILGNLLNMNMATWKSTKDILYAEERGINLDENQVEIQMPIKLSYLNFEDIVIAGYPTFSNAMKVGYTSESDHNFLKGYGKLSGKKLKLSTKVLDSLICFYKNEELICKVTEIKNDNYIDELGSFHLKAYYHKSYGFVLLQYIYPSNKIINFKLIDIQKN